jgi:hypothetical protein
LDIIVTPQRGTFISVESLYAVGFANIFTGRLDR